MGLFGVGQDGVDSTRMFWCLPSSAVQRQGLFCPCAAVRGWGAQPGELSQPGHRDVPSLTELCMVIKAEGKKTDIEGSDLSFHKASRMTSLLSWKRKATCLPAGTTDWIPCSALLYQLSCLRPNP